MAFVISYLLYTGARVEITDSEKNTALHIAARHGHGAVVKTLINNGADIFKYVGLLCVLSQILW